MEGLSSSEEQHFDVSDNFVKELVNALHEFVNISDVQEVETTSDGEEHEINECGGSEITSNQKCLSRYMSFPYPGKMYSSSDKEDEEAELAPENHSHSLQEHAPLKLVSAMKGSREKRGATPRELKVTWAPDVYDPTPTSVSHAVKRGGGRQQKLSKKDKRRGKRGHKGKDFSRGSGSSKDNSKGAGGKDKKKKQTCQTRSSPTPCYKLLDDRSELEEFKPDTVDNFGFGIPDSCGSSSSSFFKVSLTKAHYPVAEAL